MKRLKNAPRFHDMSYLVKVKTRWQHVRVYSDVRGKNIATIPHTGVLKRYISAQKKGRRGRASGAAHDSNWLQQLLAQGQA